MFSESCQCPIEPNGYVCVHPAMILKCKATTPTVLVRQLVYLPESGPHVTVQPTSSQPLTA